MHYKMLHLVLKKDKKWLFAEGNIIIYVKFNKIRTGSGKTSILNALFGLYEK